MAIHESLDPASRSGSASDINGRWVPVGGRTGSSYQWTLTHDASYFEAGATVTVRYEVSQSESTGDVVTVHTFDQLSSPARQSATVTLSGYMDRGSIRAVATIAGTLTNGTTEEANFFNITAESGRITRQIQSWDEVTEAARQAENDLIEVYRRPGGRYAVDMDAHDFPTAAREAIARQITHRFGMWAAQKANAGSKIKQEQSEPIDRAARRMIGRFTDPTYF